MVHALREAHRVLRPHGIVIDLRPDRDPGGRHAKPMAICLAWRGVERPTGVLLESAGYYADYLAAEQAVAHTVKDGLFTVRSSELFHLRMHFRSLDALDKKLKTDWVDATLDPQTRRRLRVLLRRHASAHLTVIDPFRLTVLEKAIRMEARP